MGYSRMDEEQIPQAKPCCRDSKSHPHGIMVTRQLIFCRPQT